MHAEKLRGLGRRGLPGWEEDCEGQYRHHAVYNFEVQLARFRIDAWRWWREFHWFCMEALAALRTVPADLREFMST